MHRRFSVGLLLFVSGTVRPPDFRPAELDRIIETTRKFWNVPGLAVSIVHGDDVVYMKGFGVKRVGSDEPVTPDTRFAICSSTKSFTSAALGILVDEGKLSWDDPVRKHLPYFRLSDPLADANVTIRDLLCHRTGIGGNTNLIWINTSMSREEIVRKIELLPLLHSFRSAWDYQSLMFMVAGEALGHTAGTTWEEFVSRRLLVPLGMTNTGFGIKEGQQAADHATPHRRRAGNSEAPIEPIDWPDWDATGPGSSMNSSVRDLTRWLRLHLGEGKFDGKVILKEATIHETHTPQMLLRAAQNALNEGPHISAYGLGWFIKDYRGHHVVHDPGLDEGWNGTVLLLPDERYGIAFLSNVGIGAAVDGILANAIMDELLGLPAKDRNAAVLAILRRSDEDTKKRLAGQESRRHKDTKPSLPLAEYAGTYDHPVYGTVQVRESGGKLQFEWHNWRASMEHYDFDTFRVVGLGSLADGLVQVRLTLAGDVEGIQFLGREFYRQPRR